MQNFTPGPWALDKEFGCASIRAAGGREIAYLTGLSDEDENQANGRLIVASPELVAALELAEATIARLKPPAPYDSTQGMRDIIKAVLRKAGVR